MINVSACATSPSLRRHGMDQTPVLFTSRVHVANMEWIFCPKIRRQRGNLQNVNFCCCFKHNIRKYITFYDSYDSLKSICTNNKIWRSSKKMNSSCFMCYHKGDFPRPFNFSIYTFTFRRKHNFCALRFLIWLWKFSKLTNILHNHIRKRHFVIMQSLIRT